MKDTEMYEWCSLGVPVYGQKEGGCGWGLHVEVSPWNEASSKSLPLLRWPHSYHKAQDANIISPSIITSLILLLVLCIR